MWPLHLSMLSPPHLSFMFLTSSPKIKYLCLLHGLVCLLRVVFPCLLCFFFFNLMSTYPICKYLVIFHCCFSLSDILLFCVCPFLLFLPFSSLLSTSASSALHMGMIVCTPFHLFEHLIFTQFISPLLFQFEVFHVFPLPLPSINHLFFNFPFYQDSNVPVVLTKALSKITGSSPSSLSVRVSPSFLSSVPISFFI